MKARYVNPYTDFGFKKLFGEEANKDLLKDFLNELLPVEHKIVALNFKNTEQWGAVAADRKAIFDIHCENANGERFIIEMQKAKIKFLKDRAMFYTTFPIREQAEAKTMGTGELYFSDGGIRMKLISPIPLMSSPAKKISRSSPGNSIFKRCPVPQEGNR